MKLVRTLQRIARNAVTSISCPRCGKLTLQPSGLECLDCLLEEHYRYLRVTTLAVGARVVLIQDFPDYDLYAGDPGTLQATEDGHIIVVFDHIPDGAYGYLHGRHILHFCDTLIVKRERVA